VRIFWLLILLFFQIINLSAQEINFEKSIVTIKTNSDEYIFNVEIAKTNEQRSLGLMNRKILNQNDGMIFIYPNSQIVKMWMKNTYIPLDMIFIKENGEIDTIIKMTKPLELKPIGPNKSVKAVLEINGGLTTYLNIKKGDKVISKEITNFNK